MSEALGWARLSLLCPSCASRLDGNGSSIACDSCGRRFPVLFGIPDLRLSPDRYLSLEEERAKAARLHAFAQTESFENTVDFYYSITDDVTVEDARRFARAIHASPVRAREILSSLERPGAQSAFLDLGCGAGGMLAEASAHFPIVVGVDIALRWLVIARKRLDELGIDATLICADAENVPFAAQTFSHIVMDNVLDHVRSPRRATTCAASLASPGGQLFIAGWNKYWLGPHPSAGIWAAGIMPRRFRSAISLSKRQIDVLRQASFISPGEVRGWLSGGLRVERIAPRNVPPEGGRDTGFRRLAVVIYRALCRLAPARRFLVLFGPAFEILARRPVQKERTSE